MPLVCSAQWSVSVASFSRLFVSNSLAFSSADYPNFLWAADGKLFTLAMVGVAIMSMRSLRIKNLVLRLFCAASLSALTWFVLCMLSALAFWQLTDYPYFMTFSKPPYPNQTDCTPNPCESSG
jgi:hypothetical protein